MTLRWRELDSNFQFRDTSPPPTVWEPSFRGEWRLLAGLSARLHDAGEPCDRRRVLRGGRLFGTFANPTHQAPRRCTEVDRVPARNRKFADLYGSFSVKCFFGLLRFLVWSGKAVPRPVACDQVPGARGRGQGTEMLAQLSGMPLSVPCVFAAP